MVNAEKYWKQLSPILKKRKSCNSDKWNEQLSHGCIYVFVIINDWIGNLSKWTEHGISLGLLQQSYFTAESTSFNDILSAV